MTVNHSPDPETHGLLTLDALCDRAGVTVRTVRYYIGEGLLPPPTGHGATARYTQEHLDRLAVIAAMKARFLPLKEIRRALDGMNSEAVAELATTARNPGEAAQSAQPAPATAPQTLERSTRDDPATYIATLLNRSQTPASVPATSAPSTTDATWRRVPITGEAELLIEEGVYTRRREQIESLVAWAQRVLKNS